MCKYFFYLLLEIYTHLKAAKCNKYVLIWFLQKIEIILNILKIAVKHLKFKKLLSFVSICILSLWKRNQLAYNQAKYFKTFYSRNELMLVIS